MNRQQREQGRSRWFRRSRFPSVQILRLQPGDVVVAKLNFLATAEDAELAKGQLCERFPNNKILVHDNGLTLSVVAAGSRLGENQ